MSTKVIRIMSVCYPHQEEFSPTADGHVRHSCVSVVGTSSGPRVYTSEQVLTYEEALSLVCEIMSYEDAFEFDVYEAEVG